mgnify:CR=1 FL=1
MVKFILILFLGFVGLQAKSSVDACIPIGKVVILKKSIMSLELSQEQKAKLLKYEEKLKDSLNDVRDSASSKDETLSSLFDENKFLKDKFVLMTKRENLIVTDIISEYFENMYRALTKEQRAQLIKRFQRIERKSEN